MAHIFIQSSVLSKITYWLILASAIVQVCSVPTNPPGRAAPAFSPEIPALYIPSPSAYGSLGLEKEIANVAVHSTSSPL
jgi:hypothetical protein